MDGRTAHVTLDAALTEDTDANLALLNDLPSIYPATCRYNKNKLQYTPDAVYSCGKSARRLV